MEGVKVLLEWFGELIQAPADVEKLNTAVLQWAVQGRLVAQNPNDEPSDILLKRIMTEKERLFKTAKAADVPLAERQELNHLPKGWIWVRFGEVTYNRDGERIPLSKELREDRKGEFDYYGASGVIDKIDDYLFDKPLLLIGEDGANLINRSTPIAFIAHGKYWVNNHAHVLDSLNLSVLKYLELYINATDLQPYVTGTAQPKMNQAKMNSIPVALPPFEEQKRIVEKVETVLGQTGVLAGQMGEVEEKRKATRQAALRRLVTAVSQTEVATAWEFIAQHFHDLYTEPEAVQELKQAILQLAVQGRLVPQDPNDEPASMLLERITAEKESLSKSGNQTKSNEPLSITVKNDLGNLPTTWILIRFGDVIELISGQHIQQADYNEIEDGIPYLTGPSDFGSMYPVITKWTIKPKAIAIKGDILITVKGAGLGKINIVDLPQLVISRQLMAIRPYLVHRGYVYLYLASMFDVFQKSGVGIAIPGLSREQINNLLFPLPPFNEQKRIVAKVNALFSLCDQLAAQLTTAQTAREQALTALLAQAV